MLGIYPLGEPKTRSEFFLQEKRFPQGLVTSILVVGWAGEYAEAVVLRRGHGPTQWGLYVGNKVGEEALIPFHVLLPSSVSEELKGEGMHRGGLPNNVFGVWGKGDPPAVGFDNCGH